MQSDRHGPPDARRQAAAVVAVLFALAGCATAPVPAVDRNPLERAGAPPAVAVVASTDPVEPAFASLYDDAGQGFAAGAARGAFAGLMAGMLPLAVASGGAVLLLYVPGVIGAMAIAPAAGALIGGAVTAANVAPDEKVAQIRRRAVAALAEADPSRATARSVVEDVARFTRYRADLVDATTSAGPGNRVDAAALRGRGYGAVIEVRVTRAGYAAAPGYDPELALFVAGGARLVDTATGQPTAIRGLVYQSPHRRLEAWVRDGGALERLEMAKATRVLAERIVESFLLAADEASGPGTVAASIIACGIEPVRPAGTWTWSMSGARRPEAGQDDGHLFQHPATGAADSTRPLLAWKARPAVPDDGRPLAWARAADVRYDLRIWNEVDGAPGEPVYERFGLAATEHRVEAALAPASRYYWSIRMRYTIDGRARASRWGATNVPSFDLLPALRPLVYYTGMEAGSVVRRACGATDWIACGCLDFIPPRSHYSFATP